LLAGAGASVAILAGLGPIGAVALAAIAWAGRVGYAIPRKAGDDRIDPFTLNEPWRRFVQSALQSQARFDQAVHQAERGPLRDRLGQIGDRVHDAVREAWRVARQGQVLADAGAQIDTAGVQRQLDEVRANASAPWAAGSSLEQTAKALEAQLASAQRLATVTREAQDRLRLLNARMDEMVARAIELSVDASQPDELGGLGSDVDSLVDEMEALRLAMDETDQLGGSASAASLPSSAPPPPPPPPTAAPGTPSPA
ncbi:MAG TPA: hypothetical protein PKA98_22435, partial [Acidimicrobiales bacterium]|nr:hypothetical protein [Acidimicrobiales bacterium]